MRAKIYIIANSAVGVVRNPLLSSGLLMIVGSNFANFIALAYHFIVTKLLDPSAYGELGAAISLIGLVTSVFSFLGLVIVKFVSGSKKKELPMLFSWFAGKAIRIGVVVFAISLLLVPFASSFLKIKSSILILLPFIFFFYIFEFAYRSFLQGLLKFKEVVISTNFEVIARLMIGVVLIAIGWSVFGAMVGFLLSGIGTSILLNYYLRNFKLFKKTKEFEYTKRILKYTVPVFLVSFSTNSLLSTDIVLVKHFFDPHSAGIYASLSTLGKIIFYGTAPISAVMFPMISQRYSLGKDYKKIFGLSLLLTFLVGIGVVGMYALIPNFLVTILYRNAFLEVTKYLAWFGIFILIFAICSLLLNFFLSLEKTKVASFAVAAALLQAVGIWIFHNDIFEVMKVSISSASFLLLLLLLYLAYEIRFKKLK